MIIGAPAERVKKYEKGIIIPEISAELVYDTIRNNKLIKEIANKKVNAKKILFVVQEETFFSREKLEEQVNSLNCAKKENQIAPENAYVSFVNSEFTIVPETEGNELNTKEAYQMNMQGNR